MAKKKEQAQASDTMAKIEQRIAALKAKAGGLKGAARGDAALRAVKKKLRRAQRRRRSLRVFAKAIEARHAGKKTAAAAAPAAPAPAAE